MVAKPVVNKASTYLAIQMVPNVCMILTPAGVEVPTPLLSIARLGSASNTEPTVRSDGKHVVHVKSYVPMSNGDEPSLPSAKKGIKSSTQGGKCKPMAGSSSVFVKGKSIVRIGDRWQMNDGNTIGSVVGFSMVGAG